MKIPIGWPLILWTLIGLLGILTNHALLMGDIHDDLESSIEDYHRERLNYLMASVENLRGLGYLAETALLRVEASDDPVLPREWFATDSLGNLLSANRPVSSHQTFLEWYRTSEAKDLLLFEDRAHPYEVGPSTYLARGMGNQGSGRIILWIPWDRSVLRGLKASIHAQALYQPWLAVFLALSLEFLIVLGYFRLNQSQNRPSLLASPGQLALLAILVWAAFTIGTSINRTFLQEAAIPVVEQTYEDTARWELRGLQRNLERVFVAGLTLDDLPGAEEYLGDFIQRHPRFLRVSLMDSRGQLRYVASPGSRRSHGPGSVLEVTTIDGIVLPLVVRHRNVAFIYGEALDVDYNVTMVKAAIFHRTAALVAVVLLLNLLVTHSSILVNTKRAGP